MAKIYKSIPNLLKFLNSRRYDGIVVEGYEGVGKGYVLEKISKYYHVTPYRPNYNMWLDHDLRNIDRWKISGFFWDIYSHFKIPSLYPLLFDRGVISGAVYNSDESIAKDYRDMIRKMKIMHILVVTDEDSYKKFAEIRGSENVDSWEDYLLYTEKYQVMFDIADVDYVIFDNKYKPEDDMSGKCGSCGHYSYGRCRHPEMDSILVNRENTRCEYSRDKEVQDIVK